jgi:hypothetical protein
MASSPYSVGSWRGWSGDAGRWLGVRDGGEGEEREEEDLGKILPRAPLLLCVQAKDKGKGWGWRESRERGKGVVG